jgi:photosystem II stability/assembly factor-like uncharacterized protein
MTYIRSTLLGLVVLLLAAASPAWAQEDGSIVSETNYNALEFRNIGPAINGGRIADIDFHPDDENVWYVGVGSGNVWKTMNAGTTWEPIFDNQDSYSIGAVEIDPSQPNIVWVGTGENVGGRHVGFGDGVYKSTDGGKTWTNMGLEESEHISTMIVHPENSDVVWVSAQGPLWNSGDQRGLYKTTDGGETWTKVLGNDEWTGVTDVVMDPRDPDVLYAATWDRHRTVGAYMGGGPGSGIHKSTDGGETWTELTNGIPSSNLGKIGLAISPQRPDTVYAAIELDRTTGGVFMSKDRGESWTKMSDAVSGGTGPHYYQELYASPHHHGELFLVSNYTLHSTDHGATFETINTDDKHVDDHAIAFREDDPNYILFGSDGGLYETLDHMTTWRFIDNLPVMQYHKISVDDAQPFYNVYGGTQDNGSNTGPSRTDTENGIRNADWMTTLFADGHDSATDPSNPNIFYAETQQGGLHRIDRSTGEQVYIQPQAGEDEGVERFNWDSPIQISPHNPERLYFASQRVWRSENRGDSWTAISGDLTRDQERLALPIMGKQRSWDNPWDVGAMSMYNTITSLAESPLEEGLVYAGTDDGFVHVTENGGETWREIELGDIEGVPSLSFVNDIKADRFDPNTVYVALDNHKYGGDMTPYLLKSTDRGESWEWISEDLPDRHLVWRMVQDDVNEDLLFAATEFGIYFTVDGGENWQELGGGVPTIPFRDITIQRRHDDLVGGSFGRGIFILDDYTPLRSVDADMLEQEAHLFDTRDAFWYVPHSVAHSQGDNAYQGENPPFGAVFTYYLKDGYQSMEAERKEREGELDEGEDVPFPGWDSLEAEMREEGPRVQIVVKNEDGTVVNRVDGPTSPGFHRVNWDLEYPSKDVVELGEEGGGFWGGGFMATPGTYTATLTKTEHGEVTELSDPITFEVTPLRDGELEGASNQEIAAFREQVISLQQEISTVSNTLQEQMDTIQSMRTALSRASQEAPDLVTRLHETRMRLLELNETMNGSEAKDEIGERTPPSPRSRMFVGYRALSTTYGPTEMHRETVQIGQRELEDIQSELSEIEDTVMPELRSALDAAGAPPIEGGQD